MYYGLKVLPEHTIINKDDFFVNNITSAGKILYTQI